LKRAEQRQLDEGEYLFHHGDKAESLYVLLTGEVVVVSESIIEEEAENVADTLLPGSIFGEIALLKKSQKRQRSLHASKDSTLLAIRKQDLETALLDVNPDLAKEDTIEARVLAFIQMAAPTAPMSLGKGERVFSQGESKEAALYIVKTGSLEISKSYGGETDVVGRVAEGECFGYVSLMKEDQLAPKAFSVECTSDSCEILAVAGPHFHRLLDHSQVVTNFVADLIKERSVLSAHAHIAEALQDMEGF